MEPRTPALEADALPQGQRGGHQTGPHILREERRVNTDHKPASRQLCMQSLAEDPLCPASMHTHGLTGLVVRRPTPERQTRVPCPVPFPVPFPGFHPQVSIPRFHSLGSTPSFHSLGSTPRFPFPGSIPWVPPQVSIPWVPPPGFHSPVPFPGFVPWVPLPLSPWIFFPRRVILCCYPAWCLAL